MKTKKMLKNIQIVLMLLYIKNIVDAILLQTFCCTYIFNKYILTWLDKIGGWGGNKIWRDYGEHPNWYSNTKQTSTQLKTINTCIET